MTQAHRPFRDFGLGAFPCAQFEVVGGEKSLPCGGESVVEPLLACVPKLGRDCAVLFYDPIGDITFHSQDVRLDKEQRATGA